MATNDHHLVVTYEGGFVSSKLECPENGEGCTPGYCGGEAGFGDCTQDEPCSACAANREDNPCWIKAWSEAEDLASSGYVEGTIRFPVTSHYDGEGPVVTIVPPE